MSPEPVFVNGVRYTEIDSEASIPPAYVAWRPVRQKGYSYRAAMLHWLAESVPGNRVLGSLNVYKFGLSIAIKCVLEYKRGRFRYSSILIF
jgi:hypothetical protein